jgi:hypothetical protein
LNGVKEKKGQSGYQKYQQGECGRSESSFKCKRRRTGDEIYEFLVYVGVLFTVGVTLLCPQGVLEWSLQKTYSLPNFTLDLQTRKTAHSSENELFGNKNLDMEK